MNGSFELESELGRGSTFRFRIWLPVAAEAPPADPVTGIPRCAERRLILLAEDNPVKQKVTSRLLERMGHRVDIVSNGREALGRLAASNMTSC